MTKKLKKVGLVGGIGPASTVNYYLGLIEKVKTNFNENTYPEVIIDSVDMDYATQCFINREYEKSVEYILQSISNLQAGGAQIAAITANTEHILWDKMKEHFCIPVISIVDAAVAEICANRFKRVLVLGTVFTMQSGLYEKALKTQGIEPILPDYEDQKVFGELIYPNLENGIVISEDRRQMLEITQKYINRYQADAVLLGCTEIALAIKDGDLSVPILDTTTIHINAIFEAMRKDGNDEKILRHS